jgi:hypothetical protein
MVTALWAMNHVGDAVLLDGDSLATAAGIEPAAATAARKKLWKAVDKMRPSRGSDHGRNAALSSLKPPPIQ